MTQVSTDPIADMLSRIRNAIAVDKSEVVMPHSKVKEAVAKILQENNYISDVATQKASVGSTLRIRINEPSSNSRITELKRISKPGRRQYVSADTIPTIKRGRGIVIVSTSKGIMTGVQAQKQGVGGELICSVY
jgi:small subunit ribosomal protein S8